MCFIHLLHVPKHLINSTELQMDAPFFLAGLLNREGERGLFCNCLNVLRGLLFQQPLQ